MIPNTSFGHIYVKIIGENSLLAMAQSNLLNHIERVSRVRTHTFIANNGQTEFGVSHNFGALRCYSWEDTVIDCRNASGLATSDYVREYPAMLSENRRFHNFKKDMEGRMGGFITIEPFCSVLLGEDNMRYNIRRNSKIEDFDIVRVGFTLEAKSDALFKRGLASLKDQENPFKIKKTEIHSQVVYQ